MLMEHDGLTSWKDLTARERSQLQGEYQIELDALPPTCSMETKVERFARWLQQRGVAFSMEDVKRQE